MAAKGIKASANLQARIKRMMQSDEDVGKVAKASPVLIAKALDIFLQSMVEGAAALAEGRGARMLTASHIKSHIEGEVLLDFLKDAVEAVPDLPPPGTEATKPAKQKRQRSKSGDDDEASPPKARGRAGRGRGTRSASRGGRGRGRGKKGSGGAEEEEAGEAAAGGHEEEQQHAAMDLDGQPQQQVEEQGSAGAGSPHHSEQQQPADQQQQQQPTAGEAHAGDAQAAAGEQAQGEGGQDGAVALAASIPSFLAAAAAVPGAEAEEEDYDA